MSTEIRVDVGEQLPRSIVEGAAPGVAWQGAAAPDPLPEGSWGAFLDRMSTRVTSVEVAAGWLTVTIRSGAVVEDRDLALAIIRQAAAHSGSTTADVDLTGPLPVDQLPVVFDDAWQQEQLESALRVTRHLVEERGAIAAPGPTRSVWFGPKVLEEIDQSGEEPVDVFVGVMRRTLWPDPAYEVAAELAASDADGTQFSLVVVVPERACVLPPSDRVALEDHGGVFLIPRAALALLPMQTSFLDERTQLLEPVDTAQWPILCRRARRYALTPRRPSRFRRLRKA